MAGTVNKVYIQYFNVETEIRGFFVKRHFAH